MVLPILENLISWNGVAVRKAANQNTYLLLASCFPRDEEGNKRLEDIWYLDSVMTLPEAGSVGPGVRSQHSLLQV